MHFLLNFKFLEMSQILDKSCRCLSSSKEVLEAGMCAPSGHLTYYGMYDFFRYIMCHYIGVGYEEQNKVFSGAGSHDKLTKKLMADIKTKLKALGEDRETDIMDYKEKAKSIKRLRGIADYRPQCVSAEEWKENYNSTINLINDIKPLYCIA